jgi:Phage integrase family
MGYGAAAGGGGQLGGVGSQRSRRGADGRSDAVAVVAHLSEHVGKAATALLFTDAERGGHWTEGRFRPHFFAAREAIGKDDLHFHDLRHFVGVMAAVAGATTKEVMDRLGHTTNSAAMRYQHVAAGRADTIADRLSALATEQAQHGHRGRDSHNRSTTSRVCPNNASKGNSVSI